MYNAAYESSATSGWERIPALFLLSILFLETGQEENNDTSLLLNS
jgi:hypothetical protein